MTSKSRHIEYVSSYGITHRVRKLTKKELYSSCAKYNQYKAHNCLEFPLPDEPLKLCAPEMIPRLHRLYTILQTADFKEDQYLCSLAGSSRMPEVRDLFQTMLAYPSQTLRMKLKTMEFNYFKTMDYNLRYEERLCWLRALITHEPYQLVTPDWDRHLDTIEVTCE